MAKHQISPADKKTLLGILASFLTIVVVGVALFLHFYNGYMDGILYRERLKQMQEVTTQLFSGLEDVVQNQWDSAQTFCNYMETGKPDNADDLLTFMSKQARLNDLDAKGAKLVAIDNLGRYMTQDGWQGTLEEMNLLLDDPQRLNFVSKSMTSNDTSMFFLQRLDEPVSVQDGQRAVELTYYGVACDMDSLNPYFVCEAYDDSNSVYVLNDLGMRLFSSRNSSDLIKGYSAYSTLEQMEYLHGNSFSEAKKELDATGHGYANAVLNGEEYYYALYKMDNADWTLLFLVPSSQVATNVVVMMDTTVRLVMAFAIGLLVICAGVIYMLLRTKQRQAIAAERHNTEALQRVNAELDHKNAELAEAVQVAEKATRAKSDFLANMSHDIRTPMNAIVGIANLMEHEPGVSDKLRAYIQKMQLSSHHLLSLINDILDMSKIESSEMALNLDSISLAEQIGQVDNIIRPQANERGQEFNIRVHAIAHENLIADGVRLRQVLLNLLSNAVKYTPCGGKVDFDVAEEPCGQAGHATLRFTVRDTGCGMTQEFVEHIFEPFTRGENSVTNKVQGTGLGMAITKNIVDLSGGTISVQSEPGRGSRFDVVMTLPIDEEARVEVDARGVLLISDEDVLVRNVEVSMHQASVPLAVARTEDESARSLRTGQTDVVLLAGHLHDQALPQTVRVLRREAKGPVLIFCCDYMPQVQEDEAPVSSGIDGVVARPFFLSNLSHAIDRARSGEEAAVEGTHAVLSGMRFLCAEDNELNAEISEAVLNSDGASCVTYPNGKELVDAFATVKPGDFDAILMDVQMPVMNGLEAAKAIRGGENPLGATIPIIAMTANAFTEDIQHCLDAGMNAHVAKPLDIAALERALRGLCGKFPPPSNPMTRQDWA